SIVEREYRLPEEAPRMASVFLNRLKIGMALQSCATVVYVITQRLGKPHPSRLFDRDLEIPDPFNTYRQPGLPPAPIANPGLVALSAVFRPESSRYLYFRLVDEASGRHYFSETLDEHIRAGSLSVKPGSP
ncbi:MAG TPA: endolytic transglycosylase MltG, partial [Spirochaetales bacterium]|nr:endolytic transglycosylase MltG [Spirochaetales bacterium]